ncbi:hypothetical protein [Amycolatopsis pigmentata]|uniref:Prevent-host-death family protein n=1 Tax=Amycolatopsis pigmentata TaxID=450801 RepID=A0ABW5FTJ8_9PSEU
MRAMTVRDVSIVSRVDLIRAFAQDDDEPLDEVREDGTPVPEDLEHQR